MTREDNSLSGRNLFEATVQGMLPIHPHDSEGNNTFDAPHLEL